MLVKFSKTSVIGFIVLIALFASSTWSCEYYMKELHSYGLQSADKIFSRAKTFPFDRSGKIAGVSRNKIFLTIDDGPYSKTTPLVLDILSRYGIRATFFVVGKQAEMYPSILRRAYNEGHSIGSHTYEHGLDYSKPADFLNSLLKTHRQIVPYENTSEALLFRAPGGIWNDWRTTIANDNRILREYVGAIYWNVGGGSDDRFDDADWKCWTKSSVTPEECANGYLSKIRRNYQRGTASIILMHDINPKSARMLEIILQNLTSDRSIDWEFDSLSDIPAIRRLM